MGTSQALGPLLPTNRERLSAYGRRRQTCCGRLSWSARLLVAGEGLGHERPPKCTAATGTKREAHGRHDVEHLFSCASVHRGLCERKLFSDSSFQ